MSLPPRKPSEGVTPTEREREELIAYARYILQRQSAVDRFVETGELPSSVEIGCGTHGPLRDARSDGFNRKLVGIYRPTDEEADSARAWHDFCDEHGYPVGERSGAEGYPPAPLGQSDGVWAILTWQAVRAELRGEREPRQLDLLGALA